MFTLENHVGRLVELRMASPITLNELAGFHDIAAKIVGRHSGNIVTVTDLLNARVFDQAVTDRLTSLIRQEGMKIERGGFMCGEGAVFSMQIERILRDAGYPNRRAFRSSAELTPWLGEVLTAPERQRLVEFLRGASGPARKAWK